MDHWLCFSGGNSLGSFHAGAWAAVEKANLNVTRMAGASIGAVVAAIIAGNPPDQRQQALDGFLQAVGHTVFPWNAFTRRNWVLGTLLAGQPSLYTPTLPGFFELLPGAPRDVSAFARHPMRRLLQERIDYDLLNDGDIEVSVTALDAESGDIVVFRTGETRLTVDHLMASTALPVLFRPVQIDGRHFLDAGLSQNLPLPALLDRDDPAEILAFDLYGLQGTFAPTLNGVANRAQDLMFASQSRSVLESSDLKGRRLTHVVLRDDSDDFVGKAFDFSHQSLRTWQQLGQAITERTLADKAVGA